MYIQKRSGDTEQFKQHKATYSMIAAGCDKDIAIEMAKGIKAATTEEVRDYITAQLLHLGKTDVAARYKSYTAGFSPSAIRVLRERYFQRTPDGLPAESPFTLFGRVAICMAMPELCGEEPPISIHGFDVNTYHRIPYRSLCGRAGYIKRDDYIGQKRFADAVASYHDIMISRRFMPNSPTIYNAGAPLGQLSACFVLDIPDTLSGIMDTIKDTAMIFQSGGGVGINYSDLRPAGSRVGSTAGVSSGPISFMELVDSVGDVVKQGGRRRAANMGILDVSHPDIMKFIHAKTESGALNNFNISVGTDAEFWNAIQEKKIYHSMNPADILYSIAASAHKTAEPGILFFDNINRYNMIRHARGRPLRTTNPCWGGETRVLTKDGPVSFHELSMGKSKVKVMTREDDGTLSYRIMENPGLTHQGIEVVCLVVESKQTGECMALRCTPDHQVYIVTASGIQKQSVKDLAPGTSLASLYMEDSVWEQTVGVCSPMQEVPEHDIKGTGHPTPGILPISLAGRREKTKKKSPPVQGFITPAGDIPEEKPDRKPGILSKLLNHTVLSVIRIGDADVYNGMVDITHNYFVECGENHYILSGNCGEQALYPNESCNLGSINLAMYVDDKIQWDSLAKDIRTCTRMLDGVVDMTRHPTPAVEQASNETRRIGLGVMGVSDMLMHLGIPYNSHKAYTLFGRIAEFVSYNSMIESISLAAERGPFPLYHKSEYIHGKLPFAGDDTPYETWEHRGIMPWDELYDNIQRHGIRNVLTTTIAPTGTISMIAGCSSGIEPLFSLAYTKTVSLGSFTYGCPILEAKHPDIIQDVCDAGGIIPKGMIPDEDVFVTARQIHWADHILAQAAWQRWIGNSISKTINMAASCDVSDVYSAYTLAHDMGCRGLTIYRDGSRDTQVLESNDTSYNPVPSEVAARCI